MIRNQIVKTARDEILKYQSPKNCPQFGITSIISSQLGTLNLLLCTLLHPQNPLLFLHVSSHPRNPPPFRWLRMRVWVWPSSKALRGSLPCNEFQPFSTVGWFFWRDLPPIPGPPGKKKRPWLWCGGGILVVCGWWVCDRMKFWSLLGLGCSFFDCTHLFPMEFC